MWNDVTEVTGFNRIKKLSFDKYSIGRDFTDGEKWWKLTSN